MVIACLLLGASMVLLTVCMICMAYDLIDMLHMDNHYIWRDIKRVIRYIIQFFKH